MSGPAPSTFSFDTEKKQMLHNLASSSNTSEAEIIGRALALYEIATRNVRRGQVITIKKPDGEETQVQIP
jgi:hypothetical protein